MSQRNKPSMSERAKPMSAKMKTSKQCEATKQDGSRCEVIALAESAFCFFHDPSKAVERRSAQSLGGQGNRVKTLDPGVPDTKIETSGDVSTLLSETINQVRKGVIDPRIANAVGYLANLKMRVIEQSELERRIVRLETQLENRIALASGK
jgi:hypothetical protein